MKRIQYLEREYTDLREFETICFLWPAGGIGSHRHPQLSLAAKNREQSAMRGIRIKLAIIIGGIFFLAFLVDPGLAAVISIDGIITDWPGNPATTPPYADALVVTDRAERGVPDPYDVQYGHFTNSGSDFYWRMDTVAPTDISNVRARVILCLDMDNDPGTGIPEAACNNIGAEIKFERWFQNPPTNHVAYDNGGAWTSCSSTYPESATADQNTEIRVPISVLEVDCYQTITDGMFMQQAFQFIGNPSYVDQVPDSGSTQIQAGTGSPTAVRLERLTAEARGENRFLSPAAGGFLAAFALAYLLAIRRAKRNSGP
jgi:hypothetical protein